MRASVLVLAPVVIAACTRPADVALICHNANCVAPRDRDEDDLLSSLDDSLALGPSILDGMELDLSWVRAEDRCVFAHDLDAPPWDDAQLAVDRVAAYVRANGPAAGHGDRFIVMIELKREVDANSSLHTAAEREAFVDCALDAYYAIRDAALDTSQPLAVIFESFEPALLRTLAANPRWPGATREGPIQVRLSASLSVPPPLRYSHTIDEFSGVSLDVVDVHPRLTSSADRRLYDALGYEVSLWTDTIDTEMFDAMWSDPPTYCVASEAALVRGWLDD